MSVSSVAVLHRWLGIAGGVLLVAWFASGIVMMYARMPSLADEERLERAPVLDLSAARVTPAEAGHLADVTGRAPLTIAMIGNRPVYRFSAAKTVLVFADRAELVGAPTAEDALRVARAFAPEHAATLRYDALLTEPDQWTLQARAHLPLHRIAYGDASESYLYVSGQTSDPVMKTTRRPSLPPPARSYRARRSSAPNGSRSTTRTTTTEQASARSPSSACDTPTPTTHGSPR